MRQWQSEKLTLKIIELNRDLNRLILSERATLVEADEREKLFVRIEPGQVREGTVTNLTNFGAFVDLDGVEGPHSHFRAFLEPRGAPQQRFGAGPAGKGKGG